LSKLDITRSKCYRRFSYD